MWNCSPRGLMLECRWAQSILDRDNSDPCPEGGARRCPTFSKCKPRGCNGQERVTPHCPVIAGIFGASPSCFTKQKTGAGLEPAPVNGFDLQISQPSQGSGGDARLSRPAMDYAGTAPFLRLRRSTPIAKNSRMAMMTPTTKTNTRFSKVAKAMPTTPRHTRM